MGDTDLVGLLELALRTYGPLGVLAIIAGFVWLRSMRAAKRPPAPPPSGRSTGFSAEEKLWLIEELREPIIEAIRDAMK